MTENETQTETVEEEQVSGTETESTEESSQDNATLSEEERIQAAVTAATKKANAEAKKFRLELDKYKKAEQDAKDAELSETEKLRKQLADAEANVRKLTMDGLRKQAAEKWKLPVAIADRLQGETLEELEADAEAISKVLPKEKPKLPPTNPSGDETTDNETDAQRRARMSGNPSDIFTPDGAKKFGGGVVIKKGE